MTGKYDYSAFTGDGWNDDLTNMNFWGLHMVEGRVEVDVQRYLEACEQVGINEFIPEDFLNGKVSGYIIPTRRERWDYTCNYLKDKIKELTNDWNLEYKPLFNRITTPHQVEVGSYVSQTMFLGDPEMYDDCEIEARHDGLMRVPKYLRILNEMYCMFISKICNEADRFLIKTVTKLGYEGIDYDYKQFEAFCNGKNGNVSLKKLDGYREFSNLHNVNNFIKHSSEKAFGTLVRFSPECLKSKKGYENGMYPGDCSISKKLISIRSFRGWERSLIAFVLQYSVKISIEPNGTVMSSLLVHLNRCVIRGTISVLREKEKRPEGL